MKNTLVFFLVKFFFKEDTHGESGEAERSEEGECPASQKSGAWGNEQVTVVPAIQSLIKVSSQAASARSTQKSDMRVYNGIHTLMIDAIGVIIAAGKLVLLNVHTTEP